jgi:plasmid stability protein
MTYQINTAIPDDLAEELKTYATSYGISLADTVRLLLRKALDRES